MDYWVVVDKSAKFSDCILSGSNLTEFLQSFSKMILSHTVLSQGRYFSIGNLQNWESLTASDRITLLIVKISKSGVMSLIYRLSKA